MGGADAGEVIVCLGPLAPGEVDLGSCGISVSGRGPADAIGMVVAGAGDLNADGRAELIFSNPWSSLDEAEAGVVGFVWGPVEDQTPAWWIGGDLGAHAGAALAGLGPLGEDGLDDYGIGVPGYSGVGRLMRITHMW